MHHLIAILYVILFLIILLVAIIASQGVTLLTLAALLFLILIFILLDYLVGLSTKIRVAKIEDMPQAPWSLIGGVCEVLDEITPIKSGWVRYRGELWKAYSIRDSFKPGDRAYIVDARGIYVIISREPPHISSDNESD